MNRLVKTACAAVVTVGIATSATVLARDDESGRWFGQDCAMFGMMGHGMMHKAGRMHSGDTSAAIETRLVKLEAALQITDGQQVEWNAYSEAVTERAEAMQGMHLTMAALMHEGTALERIEARISGMEAMLEALKAVKTRDRVALFRSDRRSKENGRRDDRAWLWRYVTACGGLTARGGHRTIFRTETWCGPSIP